MLLQRKISDKHDPYSRRTCCDGDWTACELNSVRYHIHCGFSATWCLVHSVQFFELGMEMRDRAPGPHIALIDPRNHNDTSALVVSAQRTYALFRKNGVKKEDIMISVSIDFVSKAYLTASGLTRNCSADPSNRSRDTCHKASPNNGG